MDIAIGFKNTGGICYFNSLIQCLFGSSSFLKNKRIGETSDSDPVLSKFFLDLYHHRLWDDLFTTRMLQHMGNIQPNQSSSEYFMALIDFLKITDIFECEFDIRRCCTICGHSSRITDKSNIILIENNFEEFFKYTEKIDNVLCDGCKTRTQYDQERNLSSISNNIVINLNKYFTKKNINYPEKIIINGYNYLLIGTIEHYGEGLNGGHYVARVIRGDKKFLIDDANVVEIGNLIPTDNTYMIFYQKE